MLESVHSLDGTGCSRAHVAALVCNDPGGLPRNTGVEKQKRRFQFANHPVLDSQRVDHGTLVGVELHEIEAPERCRVLILPAAL